MTLCLFPPTFKDVIKQIDLALSDSKLNSSEQRLRSPKSSSKFCEYYNLQDLIVFSYCNLFTCLPCLHTNLLFSFRLCHEHLINYQFPHQGLPILLLILKLLSLRLGKCFSVWKKFLIVIMMVTDSWWLFKMGPGSHYIYMWCHF